ncbi:S-layer homology domain-containing protein [Desulfotomaculum sp. 1211_IL3151]|uniref:S-layer homology domain-containing protein n=1 Tax=Desulfotomaculum sp. 1211_IL3151 TaxID=3084055 RepID=UPI002FD9878D
MRKSISDLLVSAVLIGAVSLGPAATGLADENTNNERINQEQVFSNKGTTVKKEITDLSRGEAAEMLVDALDLNLDQLRFFKAPEVKDFFDDVSLDTDYANAIMILGYNGVLHTNNRNFRPSDTITREELAEICGGLLQQQAQGVLHPAKHPQIKDLREMNKDAVDDIKLMISLNVMHLTKDGYFQPKLGVKATELKQIIKQLETYLNVNKDEIAAEIISGKEGGREIEISWGEKPSSGYEISIVKMNLEGNTLLVHYQTKEPTPGSYNSTVIVEPKDTQPIPGNYPANINIELVKAIKN